MWVEMFGVLTKDSSTVLFSPFIPFIVLFCHTIETPDTEDLRRLEEFVVSLEPACAFSEPVSNLHRLSQVLFNVAIRYTESKLHRAPNHAGPNYYMYLSELGFVMPVGNSSGHLQPHGNSNIGEEVEMLASVQPDLKLNTQSAHLNEWFSGSRDMMAVLGDDLLVLNVPYPSWDAGSGCS
jgi:hypothetical protein